MLERRRAGPRAPPESRRRADVADRVRALRRAAAQLDGLPGLVATFRGVRRHGRRWTRQPTLTCFVRRKIDPAELPKDLRIRRRIDGIRTDVIAIGRGRLHADVDSADRLLVDYDRSERKSTISVLAQHPNGGMIALGSGHGLLPVEDGRYVPGPFGKGARAVSVFQEPTVAPGSLWFGAIGGDADFGVVRFADLSPPVALPGHLLAAAPIALAPRSLQPRDTVHHFAVRRSGRVWGTIVGESTLQHAVSLRSDDGIDVAYQDVIAVVGDQVPFSLPGESGSLVFDEHRRAVGFVVGAGRDPDDATLRVSFVLRAFATLQHGLGDLFSRFFEERT
jgi:hypothetical protein